MRALPYVLLLVLTTLLSPTAAAARPVLLPVPLRAGGPAGVWPLDPRPDVVRPFEPPPSPYASGHRGADLAGAAGQPVRAAVRGTIGFAGSIGGKPVVTVLHADGLRTTYEPVVTTVAKGDPVAAGDVLGRLAVTHGHCFPAACLHWGLVRGSGDDRVYLDPLTLVGGGPVRLLPLWRDEPAATPTSWSPPLDAWRRPLDWLG
ncbi:M23 family metallopeptidase [Nocardioides sp. J2M5]|uniref:M23 family metallopeptidase n=1 Tax=Nocardioides palaemonis TaxID=2829810 RepID=UPI001BA757F5|nr:peptidoglycan DD-metalloendopeptidase family protein [Nocardioides palaemonis]MBS2937438.1 M23 family metallopeptidase [Nocardioides palaemonis]